MKLTAKVKLVSKIPQVQKELRQRVEEAVIEAAQDTAVLARQLVPVDTGALRDSITVYRNTRGNAEVGAAESYADVVEYGSSTQPAQPYLRPAAEATKPKLVRRLQRMRVL